MALLCRQSDEDAAIEAAQQAYPASAGRSCQAGAEAVTGTGDDPGKRVGERKSQPGHTCSSQEDGLLHAGGRPQTTGFCADRGRVKTIS
jgi:hypothetical protein